MEAVDDWIDRCARASYGWRPIPSVLHPENIVKSYKLRQIRELIHRYSDKSLRLLIDANDPGQRICYAVEPFPEPYHYHRRAIELRVGRYLELFRLFQVSLMILSWGSDKHHDPIVLDHGAVRYVYLRDSKGCLVRQRFVRSTSYQLSIDGLQNLYDVDLDVGHNTVLYKGVPETVDDFPPLDL